jgi:hypothetical protein
MSGHAMDAQKVEAIEPLEAALHNDELELGLSDDHGKSRRGCSSSYSEPLRVARRSVVGIG